jgi:hypothetical protein
VNHIKSCTDLLREPAAIDYLVAGTVPEHGVGVLWGETGVGKTAAAMDMAMRIGGGLDYHGRATKRKRCLYCIAEGVAGLPQRFLALCAHLGTTPEALDPWLAFRTVPTDVSLPTVRALVRSELAEKGLGSIGLFIFDTYSAHTSSGFSENDTSHAKEMGDGLREMSREHGALMLLLHHSGWNTDRIRGASDLLGTVDVSLKISKHGEAGRVITVEKARDFGPPDPLHLALRARHGGVVMESMSAADAVLTPTQRLVLRALAEQSGPVRSKDWEQATLLSHSQFQLLRGQLDKGGFIENGPKGYTLTARGCEVTAISPTSPTAVRPDISDRSTTSPMVFRSHRNGHRTSGNGAALSLSDSPIGQESDIGPAFDNAPFPTGEYEAAI